MVIDGRKIASGILEDLKKRGAPKKFLAAFLVGNDPASESFIRQKERVAKELGVDFRTERMDENITESALIEALKSFATDENCGGMILQLPLPVHINRDRVTEFIPPRKDVDALASRLILPPAVGVVQEVIKNCKLKIENSRVAVVGLGFLVGKPISEWLEGKCAEIYPLDIGSDLSVLKQADLIVLGTGQAGLVKPEMLKGNALVIDFGYGIKDGKTCGDFDSENVPDSIRYTPTPGGTGPVLVAKLLENFYRLNVE